MSALKDSHDHTASSPEDQREETFSDNVNKSSLDRTMGNGPSGSVPQVIPCGENKVTSHSPRESASFASASPTTRNSWLSNSPSSSPASSSIASDFDDFPLHNRWTGLTGDLYGYAPNGERVKLGDPPQKERVDINNPNTAPEHSAEFFLLQGRETCDLTKMDPREKDNEPKPADQEDPKEQATAKTFYEEASKMSIAQTDDPVTPAPTPITKPVDENVNPSTTSESIPVDISPLKQQHKAPQATAKVEQTPLKVDVILVGAGWCGLYLLWKLREKGLTVKLLEVDKDAVSSFFVTSLHQAHTKHF